MRGLQWNAEARSSIIAVLYSSQCGYVKLEPRTTEWNQSLHKDYTWSVLYRNGEFFPNCTLKVKKS